MPFQQEQRFVGGWRWFWAGLLLGPGGVALMVLLGVAAATGADLLPTLLSLAWSWSRSSASSSSCACR